MTPAWERADRAAAVLDEVEGWRAAGLIGDEALAAARVAFPRRSPAHGPVWRALIAFFVGIGIATATAGIGISAHIRGSGGVAALLFVLGAALAVATELLLERSGYAPTGAEAAASFFSVLYLSVAPYALLDSWHAGDAAARQVAFPLATCVLAAAAWRWGFPLYAGAAAAALLLSAAQTALPWTIWAAAAAGLAALATRLLATRDLPPSQRGGVELARAVALAGLYLAVNYYAADHAWIRELSREHWTPRARAGEPALIAAGLGSAAFPLLLLAWGIRDRERVLVGLGVVAAAASLATVRFYVHVAPLWAILAVAGAGLAGLSLAVERWLRAGACGERHGFTAASLSAGGRREQLLPLAAALAPGARELPGEPRGVAGGGGGFGGGGAEGRF